MSRITGSRAAVLAAAVLLTGCGAPAIDAATASDLQSDVRTIASTAAAGDPAGAIALARSLKQEVDAARSEGTVTEDRATMIGMRLDAVIASLEAGQVPTDSGTVPPEQAPVEEPAEEEPAEDEPTEEEPAEEPVEEGVPVPQPAPVRTTPAPVEQAPVQPAPVQPAPVPEDAGSGEGAVDPGVGSAPDVGGDKAAEKAAEQQRKAEEKAAEKAKGNPGNKGKGGESE